MFAQKISRVFTWRFIDWLSRNNPFPGEIFIPPSISSLLSKLLAPSTNVKIQNPPVVVDTDDPLFRELISKGELLDHKDKVPTVLLNHFTSTKNPDGTYISEVHIYWSTTNKSLTTEKLIFDKKPERSLVYLKSLNMVLNQAVDDKKMSKIMIKVNNKSTTDLINGPLNDPEHWKLDGGMIKHKHQEAIEDLFRHMGQIQVKASLDYKVKPTINRFLSSSNNHEEKKKTSSKVLYVPTISSSDLTPAQPLLPQDSSLTKERERNEQKVLVTENPHDVYLNQLLKDLEQDNKEWNVPYVLMTSFPLIESPDGTYLSRFLVYWSTTNPSFTVEEFEFDDKPNRTVTYLKCLLAILDRAINDRKISNKLIIKLNNLYSEKLINEFLPIWKKTEYRTKNKRMVKHAEMIRELGQLTDDIQIKAELESSIKQKIQEKANKMLRDDKNGTWLEENREIVNLLKKK